MEVNHYYTQKSIYCNTHVHVSLQLPQNRLILLHSSTLTQQKNNKKNIKITGGNRFLEFSFLLFVLSHAVVCCALSEIFLLDFLSNSVTFCRKLS